MRKRKATVRARGLGAELKELRLRAALSTRAVGERLGWSASTVSRIETGNRGVTSEEVAAMTVVYQATQEERDTLVDLAKEADQPGWWETGDPSLPKQLTALIGFEAQATAITDASISFVPGLLQTQDYARATMAASHVPTQATEARVATRMGRQVVLTRPKPPAYTAFFDEAVLRRPLGGHAVMAEQLCHLVRASQRPNITLQVIPFEQDGGGHVALSGSFMLLEFVKARTIVHLEHRRSSLFLDDPRDTEVFLGDIARLRANALNPEESANLLVEAARSYEEQ